jgi:uncharacterized protein DUF5989
MTDQKNDVPSELAAAVRSGRRSVVGEIWYYVTYYRSWMIVPILLLLALLVGLITLAGSGAAPFIYALF